MPEPRLTSLSCDYAATLALVKASAARLNLEFDRPGLQGTLARAHFLTVVTAASLHRLFVDPDRLHGADAAAILDDARLASEELCDWLTEHGRVISRLLPARNEHAFRLWPRDLLHDAALGAIHSTAAQCASRANWLSVFASSGGVAVGDGENPDLKTARIAAHWPAIRKMITGDFPVADLGPVATKAVEELHLYDRALRGPVCPLRLYGEGEAAIYKETTTLPGARRTAYAAIKALVAEFGRRLTTSQLAEKVPGDPAGSLRKFIHSAPEWEVAIETPGGAWGGGFRVRP